MWVGDVDVDCRARNHTSVEFNLVAHNERKILDILYNLNSNLFNLSDV